MIDDTIFQNGEAFPIKDINEIFGTNTINLALTEGSTFGISSCKNKSELSNGSKVAFPYNKGIIVDKY